MKGIHTFTLENIDQNTLEIPLPARILSVMEHNNEIELNCIADFDEGIPRVPVDILILGNEEVVNNVDNYTFLGTVKLFDKEMWHVFYKYSGRLYDSLNNKEHETMCSNNLSLIGIIS